MRSSSRFRFTLLAGAFATLTTIACSGVDSDLFSTTGDGGSSSVDSGSSDSGKTIRDAGKTGTDAGPVKNDGGGPQPTAIVPAVCGASLSCNSTDPTCCATQGDGTITTTSYACAASPSDCGSGGTSPLPITCRSDADCSGGNVCCGELVAASAAGGYKSVSCTSSCQAKDGANFTTHVPFCDSLSTPSSCSTFGLTCQDSVILPGFIVCGGD